MSYSHTSAAITRVSANINVTQSTKTKIVIWVLKGEAVGAKVLPGLHNYTEHTSSFLASFRNKNNIITKTIKICL